MKIHKIFLLGASVALLAAGCSKAKTNTQTPPPANTQQAAAPVQIAPEIDPEQTWVRFYPADTTKLNMLLPLTWTGDEDATDTHFVLRSRKNANGTKVDDVIMDFTIAPLTQKTISEQLTADMKDAKDTSPITTLRTDRGVLYTFASYVDASGKPALGVAVQYQDAQYIRLKVTGNIAHPYVGRLIQSISVIK